MPRMRLAESVSAVAITTGISRVPGSCFSARHTSNPSRPGIIASSRMRFGRLTANEAQGFGAVVDGPHDVALRAEQRDEQPRVGCHVIDHEHSFHIHPCGVSVTNPGSLQRHARGLRSEGCSSSGRKMPSCPYMPIRLFKQGRP